MMLYGGRTLVAANSSTRWFCVIVALGIALDVGVAVSMSPTADEAQHIEYGYKILHFHPDRVGPGPAGSFDSQMPISALNAIPRALASRLSVARLASRRTNFLRTVCTARWATLAAAACLNLFIFLWTRDLFDMSAAVAASLLFILSPNLIAHGTLATTDMYFALGVIASLYFFRRYLLRPTLGNACLSASVLALAQITKPFAIFLYPIVGAFFVFSFLRRGRQDSASRNRPAIFAGLAILFFVAVIGTAYSYDRFFTPLRAYRFESTTFTHLQQVPVLRQLPMPLPYPFLQGLDMMVHDEQNGSTFGGIYLLGELRDPGSPGSRPFKSYYATLFLFKEPIPLQILFVWGLVWVWKTRRRRPSHSGEVMLLLAAAFLTIWFSFFSKAQIGIRHILPVLSIEVIFAAAPFSAFASQSPRTKTALGALVLWLALSVASYYPHMIPYMNELVWDRKMAYRIAADSNLDWGQNSSAVVRFLKANPDVVLNPQEPTSGRILVGVNSLTGVNRWHPIRWVTAQGLRPTAHVKYGHLLFMAPPQAGRPHSQRGNSYSLGGGNAL
jgi:4-amino-4-deoxy-L-arabinose transferase-like glycosyltransferase